VRRVFVYGTLTDRAVTRRILEETTDAGAATLVGLARVTGAYPTPVPTAESAGTTGDEPTVAGRFLLVDDAGLAALDAYERVDDGLYVRVPVPIASARDPGGDTGTTARGETVPALRPHRRTSARPWNSGSTPTGPVTARWPSGSGGTSTHAGSTSARREGPVASLPGQSLRPPSVSLSPRQARAYSRRVPPVGRHTLLFAATG